MICHQITQSEWGPDHIQVLSSTITKSVFILANSANEPQISHFANFTPCEELVPILHFWKMWNSRMVNFDNFGRLTSVLKFHIFLIFNCEELVRIRAICEGLVRFFSDVKNWYSIFTNVKNQYQMLTDVKNWYQFFIYVKNWYQIFTDVKN